SSRCRSWIRSTPVRRTRFSAYISGRHSEPKPHVGMAGSRSDSPADTSSPVPDLTNALVYYVVFLLSTTLHEAAHAWAAARGGDLTAYHGGQVSLDPIPHIRREPFGMLILPLISALATGCPFGYASAPFDQIGRES